MEKELCCLFIYIALIECCERLRLWMGEEQSAAAMIGVTEGKEKNGRKTGTRIGKKFEKSGKNFEKPLDNGRRMWYTIGAAREQCTSRSEARGKARFRRNRAKKLEKSLKNLLTNERQSGIINKLRAARRCSEKHSSLKIEQQDSCILMTKVQRLRKFF